MPSRKLRPTALVAILLPLVATLVDPLAAQSWIGDASLGVQVRGAGGALAEARVEILYRGAGGETGGPAPRATNAQGQASFTRLAEGVWSLEVSHPDHLSFVATVLVGRGRKPEVTTSFLEASGAGRNPMRVRIVNAGATPLGTPLEVAPPPAVTQTAEAGPPPVPPTDERDEPALEAEVDSAAGGEPAPAARDDEPPPAAGPTPAPVPAPAAEPAATSPPAPPAETPAAPDEPEGVPIAADPSPPAIAAEPSPPAPVEPPVSAAPPPPAPTPQVEPPPPAPDTQTPAPAAAAPASEQTPTPTEPPAPPAAEQPGVPAPPEPLDEPPAAPAQVEPEPESAKQVPSAGTLPPPAATPAEPPTEPAQPPVSPPPTAPSPPSPEPPTVEEPGAPPTERAAPALSTPPPPAPPAAADVAGTGRAPLAGADASARSFRDRTCFECKPGEWSVGFAAEVPPGETGCAATALERAGNGVETLLAGLAGAVAGYGGDALAAGVLARVDPQNRSRLETGAGDLLDAASSCRLFVLSLPAGARLSGFRFEAFAGGSGGDCFGDQPCPVGDSRWLASPGIERGADATLLWAVFENRSVSESRRARFVAYFTPPAGWRP